VKCALLSNVNVESLGPRVSRHEVHVAPGFGAWTQELANPDSSTWRSEPSTVFVLVDGRELLRGQPDTAAALSEVDTQLAWIEAAAKQRPAVRFFVSTLDVPGDAIRTAKEPALERRVEQQWSAGLARFCTGHPNVFELDLKTLVEEVGRAQFYSSKRWYLGGLRLSIAAEKLVARELERILDAQVTAPKKCLLLDLDNTLWGGVLGEEGLNGIQLSETGEGARFKDFQRRIRQLGKMGVILGVVSKNNEADALEAFEQHPHMVLKKDDFAILKINWSPKPQNLTEVAQDLDIGIDSLVFLDDNPVEREAVRTSLPEVTVPEFPADTCELARFAEQLYRDHFFILHSTEEDRRRAESYRANARREAERRSAGSLEEFLGALGTKVSLFRLRAEDVPRAAQLTQKTNQFNFTTRRYSEQQMQGFLSQPGLSVHVGSVADKYGDNGKVFLSIVRQVSPELAELDTFLMSCRVMGRFLEDQILDHLVRELRAQGISHFRVQFIPTKKNTPARALLERLGGGRLLSPESSGEQTWEFDISRTSPVTRPPYAELVAF
jgi:FkbH-like protein